MGGTHLDRIFFKTQWGVTVPPQRFVEENIRLPTAIYLYYFDTAQIPPFQYASQYMLQRVLTQYAWIWQYVTPRPKNQS